MQSTLTALDGRVLGTLDLESMPKVIAFEGRVFVRHGALAMHFDESDRLSPTETMIDVSALVVP